VYKLHFLALADQASLTTQAMQDMFAMLSVLTALYTPRKLHGHAMSYIRKYRSYIT